MTTAQKKCREKCKPTLPEGKQNDRNSLRASKMASGHGLVQGTALKNGATRKMSQRYFCPAEYTLSQNLKLTLTLTFFKFRFGVWVSVLLRWAKISLSRFSGRTRVFI